MTCQKCDNGVRGRDAVPPLLIHNRYTTWVLLTINGCLCCVATPHRVWWKGKSYDMLDLYITDAFIIRFMTAVVRLKGRSNWPYFPLIPLNFLYELYTSSIGSLM